ncbi:MAG TPA: glycosyltransferase 87 family protein [Planctomycetota bacterium]|nr:glycosyltransferase 87 family protein [Planctomycetota bacterium]
MNGLRGWLLLAVVAAAGAGAIARSDWARLAWEPSAVAESDFELHWAAGRALLAGLDPYDPRAVDAIGRPTGRPDTPFCAANPLVVRLFGLAGEDLPAGYRAWRAWNLVLLAAAVLALAACLRTALGDAASPAAALAVALGLVALNDGTWMSFYYNQTNVVTLLAVVLALRAAQAGRQGAEGVLLAIATVAKTSPALLLLVAALAGRWRTLLAGLATLALLAGLSLAWNGAPAHASYLEMLRLRLGYAAQVPAGEFNNSLHDWNLAPNGLLSRAGEAGGWPASWTAAAVWSVTVAVLAALAFRLRPRAGRAAPDVLAQYAAGVAATFLVSSVTWTTHLSLAAVPCAWLVVQSWTARRLVGAAPWLLAAGAAATAVLFLPLGSFGDDLRLHHDILLKADACLALFAIALAWPRAAPAEGAR